MIAFARGAWTGVLMIRMPSAWKTVSNAPVNLARIAAMTSQAVAGELVEAGGGADARIAGQAGHEHGHDVGRRSRPGAGLLQGDPVSGIGRQAWFLPRPGLRWQDW
jgi:hypothetical protein